MGDLGVKLLSVSYLDIASVFAFALLNSLYSSICRSASSNLTLA